MNEYLNIWKKFASEKDQEDLKKMKQEEIDVAFGSKLSFGTAGARAIMGPGSNAFNIYTVRQLILAYLKFLENKYDKNTLKNKGIVVTHDNRHNSADYALEAAKIMSSYGVKTYLAKDNDLRTTPFLSYAIAQLHAVGGMNFTPSHNPKEYNGCKIYNEESYQLLPRDTEEIADRMIFDSELFNISVEKNDDLILAIPDSIDSDYEQGVKDIQFNSDLKKITKILFSPQHGTSCTLIPKILKDCGYHIESYQPYDHPDPEFTNIKHINPEDKKSFDEILIKAKAENFDQVYMVDPDSDRFAVAFLDKNKEYYIPIGNEIATLLTHYVIEMKKEFNHYSDIKNGFFVTTHVSSPLPALIARKNGAKDHITSTGFKWIADVIYAEVKKGKHYLFGYEEAIGFLPTNLVYDKDGVQTTMMFADMANYYKHRNLTLDVVLDNIYKKYGRFFYKSINFVLKDVEFKNNIIKNLETNDLNKIYDINLYNKIVIKSKEEPNPTIKFYFNPNHKDSFFAVRTSGTEPKLKIYICLESDSKESANHIIDSIQKYFNEIIAKK